MILINMLQVAYRKNIESVLIRAEKVTIFRPEKIKASENERD
jgi:hypothetical protein